MLKDFGYALRQMKKSPGFALAAALTLALGIGANAAIYQVFDAVVFRSLPVHAPGQLFVLRVTKGGNPVTFSYPLYHDLAARQQIASGLFAVSDFPLHAAVLHGRGEPHTVNAVLVTSNYFDLLGVTARLGRVFTEDAPVAVISDGFWTREFGRRNPLGQTLQINKAVVSVIGVAPPEFSGETQGNAPDMWLPMGVAPQAMAHDWLNAPSASWLTIFARLRPDTTPAQARAALESLYRELARGQASLQLEPASRGIAALQQRFQSPLTVLMAAVGMLLLIACCNLANLLLGRTEARRREFAVRLALGAGRARLVRQLLAESAALSIIGAAGGLLLAPWGARALVALASQGQSWQLALAPGWRILAFTAAIATAAAFVFGLAPALLAARADINISLRSGASSAVGRRRWMPAQSLVGAQIAIALMLLSGAGILARSLSNLRHQDFGFNSDHVLMVELPWELSPAMMARYAALRRPAYERLNALPGARAAALAGFGPMGGDQHTGPLSSPERPSQPGDRTRIVHVSPRYFEAMGVRIVAGRAITEEDRAGAPKVAVLSLTAARLLFPGVDPVGRMVSQARQYDSQNVCRVVGVAADVRFADPREPFGPVIYAPIEQAPAPITAVVVRAQGDPVALAGPVRAVIHELDRDLVIGKIRPLSAVIDAHLGNERMLATLAVCFGALALLLTCVGVYGVVSFRMARRRREIGIRMALGANRAAVTAGATFELARLVAAGALLGAVGATFAVRALRSLLFGMDRPDYLSLLAPAIILVLLAILSGFVPAHRAARLNPADTLRQE